MRKYPALEMDLILGSAAFAYYHLSTGNKAKTISLLCYIEIPALKTVPSTWKALHHYMLNGHEITFWTCVDRIATR